MNTIPKTPEDLVSRILESTKGSMSPRLQIAAIRNNLEIALSGISHSMLKHSDVLVRNQAPRLVDLYTNTVFSIRILRLLNSEFPKEKAVDEVIKVIERRLDPVVAKLKRLDKNLSRRLGRLCRPKEAEVKADTPAQNGRMLIFTVHQGSLTGIDVL